MNVVGLSQISNFTSDVFGSCSFVVAIAQNGWAEFIIDQFNKFFMIFNSCSWDDNSFGVEGGSLEFLDDISCEVVDIRSQTMDGVAESMASECSLMDIILENFIAAKEGL